MAAVQLLHAADGDGRWGRFRRAVPLLPVHAAAVFAGPQGRWHGPEQARSRAGYPPKKNIVQHKTI